MVGKKKIHIVQVFAVISCWNFQKKKKLNKRKEIEITVNVNIISVASQATMQIADHRSVLSSFGWQEAASLWCRSQLTE